MSELTPASRALIASSRVPAPGRASRVRMRAAVLATVAPGAAVAGGFLSTLAGKVVVGTLAAVVGMGTTVAAHRMTRPAAPAREETRLTVPPPPPRSGVPPT